MRKPNIRGIALLLVVATAVALAAPGNARKERGIAGSFFHTNVPQEATKEHPNREVADRYRIAAPSTQSLQ